MASATFTSWWRRPPHRFVVDYYTFGDSKSNIVQFVADVACADSAASTVDCLCFAGSVSDTLKGRTLTNYGKEVNNVCVIPIKHCNTTYFYRLEPDLTIDGVRYKCAACYPSARCLWYSCRLPKNVLGYDLGRFLEFVGNRCWGFQVSYNTLWQRNTHSDHQGLEDMNYHDKKSRYTKTYEKSQTQ